MGSLKEVLGKKKHNALSCFRTLGWKGDESEGKCRSKKKKKKKKKKKNASPRQIPLARISTTPPTLVFLVWVLLLFI
jgi:hypothetical protein